MIDLSRTLSLSDFVRRPALACLLASIAACGNDPAGADGPLAGAAGQQAAGAAGAAGQPAGGGGGGSAAGGAGDPLLIYSYAAPACGECLATNCVPELEACKTSTSCLAIAGCLSQCTASTTECRVHCDNTPWRPDEISAGLRACEVAACAAPCGITCGGVLARTADCATCGADHCCDEAAACGASQECQRFDACILRCAPGTPCIADCEQRFPGGMPLREAWRGCLAAACGEDCGRGLVSPPP